MPEFNTNKSVKVTDESGGIYNTNKQIRFKTSTLQSDFVMFILLLKEQLLMMEQQIGLNIIQTSF